MALVGIAELTHIQEKALTAAGVNLNSLMIAR
jgi:hypothetical protein